MIIDILTDSIRYALSKPKNLFVLGILNLFDFLIIPFIFALGYYYRIMKESTRGMINGDEEMPMFNNIKQLFIDGLKMLTTGIIYCIPAFIVFIILLYYSNLGYFPYYLADTISDGVFFIFYCYFYIAIPNMAYYDSFKKAFDLKQINEIIIKKIGILPIIIVLVFIDFVEFTFGNLSEDIVVFLNNLFNLNAYSTHALTFIFGTVLIAIIVTPIIDVMLSRATSLLYVNDD